MAEIFTSRITPLSYDRVNKGRIPTSPFPIFNLPIELFQDVTPYMSPQDLASLALVDADCRQLARSVQFVSCTIKDCHQSLELFDTLCRTNGRCDIGGCVRRLRIQMDLSRSSENLDSGHSSLLDLFQTCSADWESILLDRILLSLPNLSILDFDFPISPKVISRLSESSVRHLRVGGGVILPPTSSLPISKNWLLETLVLNGVESSSFTVDLLNHLSGSLRSLTWNDSSDDEVEVEVAHTLSAFTKLRSLVLVTSTISPTVLCSLIPPNTRLTSLSLDITSPAGMFLLSHGCIPTLERIHYIPPFDEMDDESLDDMITVLINNSHITALTIDSALPPSFIDSKLLPYLSSLTKLSLVWDSKTISTDSLREIALLPHLTDLSLSTHSSHLWQVDHKAIIEALKPLNASLEQISFSRDSYHVESHPLTSAGIDWYYISKPFPLDIDFETYLNKDETASFYRAGDIPYEVAFQVQRRIMDLAWERWHRECMVSYAKAYGEVFGKMRSWVGGQIGVEILRGEVVWVDTQRRGKRYSGAWI